MFFVVAFIFVILLQSIGMMFHIIETLEQIVSQVSITDTDILTGTDGIILE